MNRRILIDETATTNTTASSKAIRKQDSAVIKEKRNYTSLKQMRAVATPTQTRPIKAPSKLISPNKNDLKKR